MGIVRRSIVAGVFLLASDPAVAGAGCEVKTREAAIAYIETRAPGANMLKITGLEADRFRALWTSLRPQHYRTGERIRVERKVTEVRLYWMRPLVHELLLTDECARFAGTQPAWAAEWVLHRLRPDAWPMPDMPERADGA